MFAAPASPSGRIPCTLISAEMTRSHGLRNGCTVAGCVCCSILFPTTPPRTIPGFRTIPTITCTGPRINLRENRTTTREFDASHGPSVLAYGRDPYFAGWPDTLQLNYAEPGLQEAMASELESIAGMCDGVRCDMAMLILPDVFERTWGLRPTSFWPMATQRARARHPGFLFMAEVYWDLEWTLQQQGFDYTYDKRLYDRLCEGHARPVRDHFRADMDFQRKSARFLENHDEPRAAATFQPERCMKRRPS